MANSVSSVEMSQATTSPRLPNKPFAFSLYFLKYFKGLISTMFVLEAGQAACHILLPYSIKVIIDSVSSTEVTTFEAVKSGLILFALLSIGEVIFSRASGALLIIVGPSLRKKTRFELYHYLQYHSQRYFMSNFAGSLANRISEVAMSVSHTLWTILFDFWPVTITFSVSFYLLFGTHTTLALVLGTWTILYVFISFILAKKCRIYAKEFAAARSTVSGKIVDAVTNIMNTKLFSHLRYERRYLRKYLDNEVGTARKTFWYMEKMRWFQFTAALLLKVAMIGYGAKLWSSGTITVGQFSMITTLSLLIITDARNLSRRFLEFFEYIGNINDGVNIIVKSHEIIDTKKPAKLLVKRGEINLKNVGFEYTEGKKVFDNLNLKIEAGQKVGLVGFSGSGKTTLVNLILRFFDIQKGQILIDGENIDFVSQDDLRSQISMIPQESMLFHRTMMENIRYGRLDASDEDVIEAAMKAHAHEFIQQMNDGYSSLVGERGVKLSGGQRQRVAIARAILKNAPILIMDEATSSLDSITEEKIQQSLTYLMKNRTVIVIAHRLSTLVNLDRIVVFSNGKIVEEGSHLELLSNKGHYYKLWSMQAGGFLPEQPHLESDEYGSKKL